MSVERSKKVAAFLQHAISSFLIISNNAEIQKKVEIKEKLSKELISRNEFSAEMKVLRSEMKVYFVILLCIMVVLNRESIALIGQIFGFLK